MQVAVIKWATADGTSDMLVSELEQLGHEVVTFTPHGPVPAGVDLVLTFGPFGPFLPVAEAIGRRALAERPAFVHWNTEEAPNPAWPSQRLARFTAFRSYVGRLFVRYPRWQGRLGLDQRALRLRFFGDYHYAYRQKNVT